MNIKKRTHRALFCLLSLLLSGCSLAPTYSRPESPVADTWPQGTAYTDAETGTTKALPADTPWKEFFSNKKLQQVLELALSNNRDLRSAALNIEKTRALYRIQRADQFPMVNGQASGSVQRIPESLSSTGESVIAHQYNLNVGVAAWELDFFGRVESLKTQALEQFFATQEARSSLQISLLAETASAWLTLSADKERLKLARDTFNAQQSSYEMINKRFEVGASSELDLRRAQTRVEAARLDTARYTGKVAQDVNLLTLLVGAPVPADLLPEELAVVDRADDTVGEPAPGLSSTVLLNRPDILSAERQLKAANARIGAARAAFFPRITLTGAVGVASDELGNLFSEGMTWSFMPQVSIPIFTAGRNQANLETTRIQRDIAVTDYEKSIQTAFREVADALSQSGTVDDQLKAQTALLAATAESYRLSNLRYEKGIDSYLNVLDAQRSLYSAQQTMIDIRLLKLANRVTLYKVLGGGSVTGANE